MCEKKTLKKFKSKMRTRIRKNRTKEMGKKVERRVKIGSTKGMMKLRTVKRGTRLIG